MLFDLYHRLRLYRSCMLFRRQASRPPPGNHTNRKNLQTRPTAMTRLMGVGFTYVPRVHFASLHCRQLRRGRPPHCILEKLTGNSMTFCISTIAPELLVRKFCHSGSLLSSVRALVRADK